MLDTGHTFSMIDQIMELLHIEKQGHKLNTLERLHIYNLSKKTLQMNDTYKESHNPILELSINTYTYN
jgi:hypothetical protein